MVSRTVLVLLVICALLVADSEGWRRRRRRWFRIRVRRLLTSAATKMVLGKRETACDEQMTSQQAHNLATELENTCTAIGVNLAVDGLNLTEVKDVFGDSDVDGDGVLLKDELFSFAAAIKTTELCALAEEDNQS